MPELRKDPVVGRWVIISTERSRRPTDFTPVPRKSESKNCPFCPGNEAATPPEILAFRPDKSARNTPGWTVRVISNKYPALRIEGDLNREGVGIFDKMNGVGAHEVIIETPDHTKELAHLSPQEVSDVLWAYRERMVDLKNDPRFRYLMIFKNQGEAAGASLEHAHSQLIALPIVPQQVLEELEGAKRYYDYKERCIFCDGIRQDIADGERVVGQTEHFVALEPFAPRYPFETWILPRFHDAAFERLNPKQFPELAGVLRDILLRLERALANPPFNYILHTSPVDGDHQKEYHWHFEIMPTVTRVAGFEKGTGFFINPTSPEEAAQYLNEIKI